MAQTPNHLLGQDSPYLLQHLYNAVDWYPWGPEALEKAKAEGKPIFLSIGYSSCHWCHVMEEESFENAEIGAFLNQHFIAIKIDRERRPDLDEQFMLVTQTVSGAGGWPNSVFLTPDAKPFFAGTYFPPEGFLDILGQIETLWRTDRTALESEAANLSATVQQHLNRSAAARNLTPEIATSVARRMLMNLDSFYGGFGSSPKFPQESAFLFLLDQAERDQNREFFAAVTSTLDGMIMGGIHDQVGGGFHRYSVDPAWHVPHFEKMLYNQAMIGRLLTRTARITGREDYRRAALRTFDYVLREMTAPLGGFYSAQDADSLDTQGNLEEGVFYTWTPAEIRVVTGETAEYLISTLNVTDVGNLDGSNSMHLSELTLDPIFDAGLEQLRIARNLRPEPFTDQKIITAWNGAMIETLAEAAHVFQRPDYYQAAEKAARYILDNMMRDGNLYRISFEGNASVDGQLPDYASLGLAFLALHDFAPDGTNTSFWLTHAEEIATAIDRKFSMPDGTYRMAETVEGLGAFRPFSDSEIPSGNGMVLALWSGLANRITNPEYTRNATKLAAALSGHILSAPEGRAYSINAAQIMTTGSNGAVRFVANGVVRVEIDVDRAANTLSVTLRVKDGWHINANQPLDDYFIATTLTIDDTSLSAAAYPEAVITTLAFNTDPLALYENTIRLTGALPDMTDAVQSAALTLQACNDEICLAPEEIRINLW